MMICPHCNKKFIHGEDTSLGNRLLFRKNWNQNVAIWIGSKYVYAHECSHCGKLSFNRKEVQDAKDEELIDAL